VRSASARRLATPRSASRIRWRPSTPPTSNAATLPSKRWCANGNRRRWSSACPRTSTAATTKSRASRANLPPISAAALSCRSNSLTSAW